MPVPASSPACLVFRFMITIKKVLLILGLTSLVAAVLFVPIPEYHQKAFCSLPEGGGGIDSSCGREGWYLGNPIFTRIKAGFFPVQQTNRPLGSSSSNYEDCLKSSGTVLRDTYPTVCVTKDGRQFTEPEGRGGDCSKVPPMADILCAQGYHSCQAADSSCELTCCKDN